MNKRISQILVPNTQSKGYYLAGIYEEINSELIQLIKENKLDPKPLMVSSGGTTSRCAANGHWTLDLSKNYTNISFDSIRNEVEIESGVKMKSLIDYLSQRGRSFPIGLSGLTGVGYVLTGGVSPLSRKYGLAIDNITQIKGIWGNGDEFSVTKPHAESTESEKIKWRGLTGAAPFLAIVKSIKLKTQEKKKIYIWESILELDQLFQVILEAESWPNNASLCWSWEEKIKAFGIFEIEYDYDLGMIETLISKLPQSNHSITYVINGLSDLPPISKPKETKENKYSEVVGLLGPNWGKESYTILKELEILIKQRPDEGCYIASQQLGGQSTSVHKGITSFVHRNAIWKPWITGTWTAGNNKQRQLSLQWIERVWDTLNPLCPGIHLAQLHNHLPWNAKAKDYAFNDWLKKLRELKSSCDPKGILPGL